MNNGMSPSGEDALRAAVGRARAAMNAFHRVVQEEQWDFQSIEALLSQIDSNMQYVTSSIQRGIMMLAMNGEFERILGLPIDSRFLTTDPSVPSPFSKMDIREYLRKIREQDRQPPSHDDIDPSLY